MENSARIVPIHVDLNYGKVVQITTNGTIHEIHQCSRGEPAFLIVVA